MGRWYLLSVTLLLAFNRNGHGRVDVGRLDLLSVQSDPNWSVDGALNGDQEFSNRVMFEVNMLKAMVMAAEVRSWLAHIFCQPSFIMFKKSPRKQPVQASTPMHFSAARAACDLKKRISVKFQSALKSNKEMKRLSFTKVSGFCISTIHRLHYRHMILILTLIIEKNNFTY